MSHDFSEGIDENLLEKTRIFPAWFCKQMLNDGAYAILLTSGTFIAVRKITGIHADPAGQMWLDVLLMPQGEADMLLSAAGGNSRPIGALGERHKATLNTSSIMLAYEIALTP
jgi:hypothetical protein